MALNFEFETVLKFYNIGPGCFTCGCLCFVSLSHGAMGWSAVCDCGNSWSYSLAFRYDYTCKEYFNKLTWYM